MIEFYQIILNTSDSGVPKSGFFLDLEDNAYGDLEEDLELEVLDLEEVLEEIEEEGLEEVIEGEIEEEIEELVEELVGELNKLLKFKIKKLLYRTNIN